VRIGRGAVIAAGSVVAKDVAPHTLVAGVPSQVVYKIGSASSNAKNRQIY
jgi:tetrahydrodipicolinate N-acetyltransferase